MTTAHHLRLIDEMRTREFPVACMPSVSGVSGPGYHTAFLRTDHELRGDDEPAGPEHRAQCLVEHDALLTLLTARWGEPQLMSLWSAQERTMSGEVIPAPWADPVAGCEFVRLWRVEGRWIAIGLVLEEGGPGCELTVLVTVIDPP
ncbi:hypothetical protein AB0407_22375 [Streptomyces microflavus]|uniref:Uncharacterized protein n=1 Tax=Streptomyces microflavus DSM 40593 TaxID=1303692 RepID=N0CQC8_STRMI|nr:hypothetical protein [Streptomyces microflavus]AGK75798.1 hypothetical protein SFUL_814 [Streptomyces microflavus DSM 40593]